MSPTEKIRSESFFAEFLLPLRHANLRRKVQYLQLGGTGSNWAAVASRTGGLQHLSADGVSGSALLEQLGRHWRAQGDANLPKLAPFLLDLRRELTESGPISLAEPELPEYVYTVF